MVLVNSNLEEVKREINERLYLTLKSEKNLKNLLKIVVREGNHKIVELTDRDKLIMYCNH